MLFTIGYEASQPQDFVATLQKAGVTIVADIRDRPQSRKAGFSKTALSETLRKVGIIYIHFRELGDPPEGREAARLGDYARFRHIFSEVMAGAEAKAALSEIESLAEDQSVCLLCYERNPLQCHRKIVSDALELRVGGRTTHLGVQPRERLAKCA